MHICVYQIIADVYLSLNGTIIPNHGYVVISDIGSDDESALLCHTNRHGNPNSGGDWFAPDETRVGGTDVPGLTRNRGPMVVRLKRTIIDSPTAGIYSCSILESGSEENVTCVHVGLYSTTVEGRITDLLC